MGGNDYRKTWYSSAKWQRRRRYQLATEPLCAMCLANGVLTPATVVDHVIPHRGDRTKFWLGKLASLCKPHHDRSKQQIERQGYSNEIGIDGFPTDPNHAWYQHDG